MMKSKRNFKKTKDDGQPYGYTNAQEKVKDDSQPWLRENPEKCISFCLVGMLVVKFIITRLS